MVRHLTATIAVLGGLAPLPAATLERLSLDDMIQKSTAVVRGHVDAPHAAFRGNVIYTHYPVQVVEQLKGTAPTVVDVMVPGGTVGAIRQTYSGVPQLTEGKEYVLFLWTGKSGITQVIGFTQGVFRLTKGEGGQAMVVQQLATATVVDPTNGQVIQNSGGLSLRLSDLRTRIATSNPGANQ